MRTKKFKKVVKWDDSTSKRSTLILIHSFLFLAGFSLGMKDPNFMLIWIPIVIICCFIDLITQREVHWEEIR